MTHDSAPSPDPHLPWPRRLAALVAELRALLPADAVITDPDGCRVYDRDGLTAHGTLPPVVALPGNEAEVAAVLRLCHRLGVPVVPRGAGTSLSGGAHPHHEGLLLGLGRLDQLLALDPVARIARAQTGLTNAALDAAARPHGLFYAPDPSSQIACTLGGNVAENAGGVHCLKYGLTTHNVLGVRLVLADGTPVTLGGPALEDGGYDLLALVTGSEGLLGVVTEVTVRLRPRPEALAVMLLGFDDAGAAADLVATVIDHGILPAGMEMMDNPALCAAEDFVQAGYPRDAAAVLIVELDGTPEEVAVQVGRVRALASDHRVLTCEVAHEAESQARLWAGRKAAFPAMGQVSPDYYVMDGTIPRHRLPEVLRRIAALSADYGLAVANVFHAGDGNLHPLILYDGAVPGAVEKAEAFGADILRLCVAVGGVLTGEHGVGLEKRHLMPEMFSAVDLAHQERIKCAFDPDQRLNPGKVFPQLHRCAELGRLHVHGGALPFPHLPRF